MDNDVTSGRDASVSHSPDVRVKCVDRKLSVEMRETPQLSVDELLVYIEGGEDDKKVVGKKQRQKNRKQQPVVKNGTESDGEKLGNKKKKKKKTRSPIEVVSSNAGSEPSINCELANDNEESVSSCEPHIPPSSDSSIILCKDMIQSNSSYHSKKNTKLF